jgi:hypothetical protein
MSHTAKPSLCLNCGKFVDRAEAAIGKDDPKPEPGDITICFGCGHVMAFDEELGLRELTKDEETKVADIPDIAKVRILIRVREKYKKTLESKQ